MPMIAGKYRRPQLRNARINYRHGWFFVTFQVFRNKSKLGAIVGEECALNRLGEAVRDLITSLPKYNPEVHVDCFVVMPNHVHLILKIDDRPGNDEHHLGKIMRKLKSLAAREYRLLKEQGLARDIGSHLWQENYWEKIITRHDQLEAIRRYIANNPKCWSLDRFGPVTSYSRGNLGLLDERFEAFVASEGGFGEQLVIKEWIRARGTTPPPPKNELTHPAANPCPASGPQSKNIPCPASGPQSKNIPCPASGPQISENARLASGPQSKNIPCPASGAQISENARFASGPQSSENACSASGPQSKNISLPASGPQSSENISGGGGIGPRQPPPIISTFTSPQEREVLSRLAARKRRFIAIYPGGIPASPPRGIADAVAAGRALLLSPVQSGTGVNKQRAIWCNEYAIKRAGRVWCGRINPGGTLHSILKKSGFSSA